VQRKASAGRAPVRKRITSIEELKQEARGGADFALLLNYGLFSRKTIDYDESANVFSVWNHIDDTHQKLTEAQLQDRGWTHIGEAIRKGALVKLDEEPA
jgi:hypothetical protein